MGRLSSPSPIRHVTSGPCHIPLANAAWRTDNGKTILLSVRTAHRWRRAPRTTRSSSGTPFQVRLGAVSHTAKTPIEHALPGTCQSLYRVPSVASWAGDTDPDHG